MKNKFITVQTTYPNLTSAKNLAKILLKEKLAACIQFSKIESLYLWNEKIENSKEILVNIKTKNSLYLELEKIIKKHHVYENPQIISSKINQGYSPYLYWIESNLKNNK